MASWKQDSSGNWKKSGSSKKNYTIVNGQKVEQTKATASAPSTSSDTWNKETVTLDEAAQQTKDVESGVINVNTGSTSIETPATTEKLSLDQAAAQTQTESANRVLATEAEQTPTEVTGTVTTTTEYNPNTGDYTKTTVADTETTYNNLSAIKAGSNIKSTAQLDPITIKNTKTESKTTNLKDTALGQLNAYRINSSDLKQEETTSIRTLTAEENASLRKDILGDQTLKPEDTLSSSTSLKSRELASAYEQQDTDLYNASRLGGLEPAASKYESVVSSLINAESKVIDKVNVLDKVTGKSINQPFADFVLSAGEALALTPVSTARMAASAVRDPLGTARASVEQPIEAIIENPAKGLGSLAGSLVGGVALAKIAGVGGSKVSKVVKEENLKIVERKQTTTLNELKTVPESVKSMPDVNNPAVKMEIPEVGRIRNTESFKVRNSVNNDVSAKQSLKSDSFSIRKQTNTNKLAKVENPELSANYSENIAELNKFKKKTDFTGDFFERVENPTFRAYDTKPGIRPQPDDITIQKPSEPAIDKYAKKREWSKDDGIIDRKPVSQSKMVENELADALVQKEYFTKKNMQVFIEDERGSLFLDEISIQKSKSLRQSPRESITGEFKQTTIKDRIDSFRNVEETRITPRPKRTELVESLEDQISSKGKTEVPSLKEQVKSKNRLSLAPKSKSLVIPAISQKPALESELTPKQHVSPVSKQSIQQTSKQTTKQQQKSIVIPKLQQSLKSKQSPKQTTPQQQEPIIKDPVKPPSEPIKTPSGLPRMPRLKTSLPAEVTPRKDRSSSKKGKKSQVKTDTIKNTYIDPMKALGRRKL